MKSENPLPKIGTPCPKQWQDMTGDAQRRFCDHCQLHVHNLSAMSTPEREQFLATANGRACIAYELRPDGSEIIRSRWSWLWLSLQRVQWSVAALLAALVPFLFPACASRRTLGRTVGKPAHTCETSKQAGSGGQGNMLLGDVEFKPDSHKPQ